MSGPPLASVQGCILVRIAPGDKSLEELKSDLRGKLAKEISGAIVRFRVFTAPGRQPLGDYPISLAVHGPGPEQVRKLAGKLAEKLGRSKKLIDVWVSRAALPSPQIFLNINRELAAKERVAIEDIFQTGQVFSAGSRSVTSIDSAEPTR